MEKREFKTESKRLLDLMINSIYTNKDIFLRELISNASDACDKLRYYAVNNPESQISAYDSEIKVLFDEKEKTIEVSDDGIGMTKDELIDSLGVIAKSGSKEFMDKLEKNQDFDVIGQFGVGFYSSFMVSDNVTVITKSPKTDKAYKWFSEGLSDYTIEETTVDFSHGTRVILKLREDTEEFEYSKYLSEQALKDLILKYSDFIKYPIKMYVTHTEYPENKDSDKEEVKPITTTTLETINSMKPVWKKTKDELKENEYEDFYMKTYNDYEKPFEVINYKVEGNLNYTTLLFIPKNFNQMRYLNDKKGLDLYSKGVFIQKDNKDLLPEYLGFVKGIVDTNDISLNISREILQQTSVLKKIKDNVEKKIIKELKKIKKNDRKRYLEFFKQFGTNIKFGIYQSFGQKKDLLADLLVYESLNSEGYIDLKEYIDSFRPGQKEIFYITGEKGQVANSPELEKLKSLGYNVLFMTDQIDDFTIQMLKDYEGHDFKDVSKGNLDIDSEDDKEALSKQQEADKALLDKIKETNSSIANVELTNDLLDSAYTLTSGEGVTFEMEKLYKAQGNDFMKASRVLKFNPNHKLYKRLKEKFDKGEDISDDIYIIYNQALLNEGLDVENKQKLTNKILELLSK